MFARAARRALFAGTSIVLILAGTAHADFQASSHVVDASAGSQLSIAVDPATGLGELVWRRTAVSERIMYAPRFDSGLVEFPGEYSGAPAHDPVVASGSGNTTIAFLEPDGDATPTLVVDSSTVGADPSQRMTFNDVDDVRARVAVSPDGKAVLAWRANGALKLAYRPTPLGSFTVFFTSTETTVQDFAVDMGASGLISVAYVVDRGAGAYSLETAVSADAGVTVDAQQVVAPIAVNRPVKPSVGSTSDDQTVLAWNAGVDNAQRATRPAGASADFGAAAMVGTSANDPVVVVAGTRWAIAYKRWATSSYDVALAWDGDVAMLTPTPGITAGVELAADINASGAFVVAWDRGGTIEARTGDIDDRDGFAPVATISPAGAGQPVAVVDGAGVATVAFPAADGIRANTTGSASPPPPADTTAPTITITSPADGQQVTKGAGLVATYACSDASSHTCTGNVSTGTGLDTTHVGAHTFTVLAQDIHGNSATKTVTYKVVEPAPVKPVSVIGTAQDPFANLFGYAGMVEVKELTTTGTIGVNAAPRKLGATPQGLLGDAANRGVKLDTRRGGNLFYTNAADIQRKLNGLRFDPNTGAGYFIALEAIPTALADIEPEYRTTIAAGDVWDQRFGDTKATTLADPMKLRIRYYEPQLNCGPSYRYVHDAMQAERQRIERQRPAGWSWEDARTYMRTFGQGYDWFNCEVDVVFTKRAGITRSRITGEKAVQQRGQWVLQFTVDIPKEKPAPKRLPCPINDINTRVLNGQPWDDTAPNRQDGTHNVYDAYRNQQAQDLYDCRFDVVFDKMAGVPSRQAYKVVPPTAGNPVATIHVWEPRTPDLVTTVRFNAVAFPVTGGTQVPPLRVGTKATLSTGTLATFAVSVSQAGVAFNDRGEPVTRLGGAEVDVWFDPDGRRQDAVQLGTTYATAGQDRPHAGETNVIKVPLDKPGVLRLEVTWRGVGKDGAPYILNGWHTFEVDDRAPGCYQAATDLGRVYVKYAGKKMWYRNTSCPKGTIKRSKSAASLARGARYDKCIGDGGNWFTCLGASIDDLFSTDVPGSKVAVPPPANRSVAFTCKGGDVRAFPKEPTYGTGTTVLLGGGSGGREGRSSGIIPIPPGCMITAQQITAPGKEGSSSNGVISTGGGNVISTGGGNVISTGGGNVISTGGGNVISTGGGNVIATGGGNVISTGGGNVISTGGGNVISTGGGNLIGQAGGN